MTTSIFSTTGFNFDSDKFGDAITLSEAGTKTLEMMSSDATDLKDWQLSDMATGAADVRTNYFQNKQAANCSIIRTAASLIYTLANTYTFNAASNVQNTMISSASSLIIEVDKFKTHTDNVSGVSDPSTFRNTDAGDIPHLDTATGLSQQLLTILKQTDDISNSTPLLGSMTSLFVQTEVGANAITLTSDAATLNSSIYTFDDGLGNTFYQLNVSSNVANTIIADMDATKLLLNTRRTHDWNFYVNGKAIVRRHAEVTRFDNMGDTQLYLVNNLIGTDTLKTNLSSG